MKNLPKILNKDEIRNLEAENTVEYFNYIGESIDMSTLSERHKEILLTGDTHVLIGSNLYVKDGNQYIIYRENFEKTW